MPELVSEMDARLVFAEELHRTTVTETAKLNT